MRIENGESLTVRNFIVCTIHLIVRVIKSRRLRWTGHVTRMEEGRSAFKILTNKLTGWRLREHLDVDRRTILELIFNK